MSIMCAHTNICANAHNLHQSPGLITLRVLVIPKPIPSRNVSYSWCFCLIWQLEEKVNVCASQVEGIDANITSQVDSLKSRIYQVEDDLESFSEV